MSYDGNPVIESINGWETSGGLLGIGDAGKVGQDIKTTCTSLYTSATNWLHFHDWTFIQVTKFPEIFALYETSPVAASRVGAPGSGDETVYGALKVRTGGSTGGLYVARKSSKGSPQE